MYDKNGNIPELEQWIFDGEVYYHHNVRHITQPVLQTTSLHNQFLPNMNHNMLVLQ